LGVSSATALLADAETSIKAGEWDQALEQLENLKKDQPSQPEVYEKLALVLAVRGKFQSVISTYLELVSILVAAEDLQRADGMVNKVLELRPDSGEARERRIEIENKRGNVARAVYLSRELARLCIDQGDGERSIRLLQDALKHEPGNLDIALELAEMFVSHGHIQDGANQYRKVANAFQTAGNIAKAAEAYRRMKVVQSDDPEVLLTLGRLYTELGKLDEAEQEFRSVLRHDLDHEQALLQLGLVCQLKGRFRSGILAFNKVLQNNPNLVSAKRKLGELHHSQGMMTEAVDFFLQAAQGHLEADEKDDAIECFQIVLSVDENNAPAQQGLTNLGAPVQPKTFEPPQPPTLVEEDTSSEPPPPPPVPFAPAAPPASAPPEPVGGSAIASEQTERLAPINFDAPADPEPPKPEATPKRPIGSGSAGSGTSSGAYGSSSGAGSGGAGASTNKRVGLTGMSMKAGLGAGPGGDKPMLGDKPTLGRPGLVRPGLDRKSMGGPGAAGDKPMLGGPTGPGDRRPQLGTPSRLEPNPPAPTTGPSSPSRPSSFGDSGQLDDFSADMAFDGVFAEPSAGGASSADDDFPLPEPSFFDDHPVPGSGASMGQSGSDLFDSNDNHSIPAPSGPKIGGFSGFDSDEDSGGAPSSLRPSYADETTPDFGEDIGDDLFNFDTGPDGPPQGLAPTLSAGGRFDDDDGGGDDLFGETSDDLFGDTAGGDLFGDDAEQQSASKTDSALFEEQASLPASQDQGLFDGDSDPFANLFDEPTGSDPASETLGGVKPALSDLTFDDEEAMPGTVANESSFGSLFDEPEVAKSIPISTNDDLFGADDDFFSEPGASPLAATPTLSREPDEGLFGNDGASNDLFGDDDMFPGAEVGGLNPGFSNPAAPANADDLFSGSDDGEFTLGGAGLDAPLDDGLESEGLFGDDSSSGGLFESVEESAGDIFNDPSSGGDLFGTDDSSGGLFGDPVAGDDFASNGAPIDGDELFGSEYGGLAAPTESGGLFDGLDSGSDTLFDGFDSGEVTAQPSVATGGYEQDEASLFGADADADPFGANNAGDDGLFGGGDAMFDGSDSLFGEPEPLLAATPEVDDLRGDGGSLFDGEFSSQEEDRDDIRLPLSLAAAPAADSLFTENEDEGSLFDIPLTSPDQGDSALETPSFEEPDPISIPDPTPEPDFAPDNLFDDDNSHGRYASTELDDTPPPLDLDLPMPDDPPMFSESTEPATSFVDPSHNESSPFDEEPNAAANLFSDDNTLDIPLDFEIPEPSDAVASEPDLVFAQPEPVSSPEPFVDEAPDFMDIFDSTMPQVEEEAPLAISLPEPEPVGLELLIPEAPEEESTEITVNFGLEEDVFDASLELMPSVESDPTPIFEEPIPVEPDPADLLSAEEKAEIAQTAQADALDAQLAGQDAAFKIATYRKQLEEHPDNLVLRTRLADIHLKYGLLEDAVVQYRQVMRRNPDSIPLLHRVIQAEFWNENYVEAGDSLLALAQLHLKRGEQHEALDTLQSVLSLDPLHFEARKELVSVFTALDDSKLAAHHLRQLAETALTKGEVAGAISAFQQLLEISADPTFEERLAQIYESQGDVVKALSSFQSLVGRYRAEERWEEAARVTERIVELDPNQLGDREALIALYQRLGHTGQAVEQQFQLARRYQERNETERAISLYEEVLKFQIDNQEARRFLVDAYLDAGRVSAALEQAEALTEHYLDTKDHHTAIYLYSRLVDADPENVELQERLVKFYGLAGDPENAKSRWVHISNLHERNGRYDRAAEAVQKALELDESQVDLQHRLALLYAERLGDNQSALGQLRKLFHLAPDRMDAVKMYIDLLLKEEQVSEAGQVLQRLEQAGGESVEIKSNVIALLKASVEGNPSDLKARFNYGELCYHLGDLDHAIEQFQQTRRHPDFELISYNMLGLCFASKRGYMMLDLAVKQFQKGLESKGRSEMDYLEIRYNLAMVQYQNGRAKEALVELKECYNVDIAYRDVRSWIQKIEGELASGS
jgi:tetratricopeptide (TPR) repeat protein